MNEDTDIPHGEPLDIAVRATYGPASTGARVEILNGGRGPTRMFNAAGELVWASDTEQDRVLTDLDWLIAEGNDADRERIRSLFQAQAAPSGALGDHHNPVRGDVVDSGWGPAPGCCAGSDRGADRDV